MKRVFNRRLSAVVVAVAVAAGTISLAAGSPRKSSPEDLKSQVVRPYNVLLIVPDDQALRSMEPMQKTRRWFKGEGVKLTNAYVTTPLCCPSRASFLTGRYSHNHKVRRNQDSDKLDVNTMVQRTLKQAGYRTAVFGKFLNSWDVTIDPPFFDDWAIIPRSFYAYRDGTWNVNGSIRVVEKYGTSYIADKASRFIESAAEEDRPWFAYLAPPPPHSPFTPERRYRKARVSTWKGVVSNHESDPSVDPLMKTDKPPYVMQSNEDLKSGRRIRTQQFRTLMSLDDLVAQVRRTLKATGEDENTMVIYYSDNGYLWGQHGLTGKGFPYTESVEVPAFIRWPETILAGTREKRLVANIDMVPTILDAIGLAPDLQPDGRSLLDPSWQRERLLIEGWSRHETPTWAGLISLEESYVEYYGSDGTTIDFREFYDLQEDPYEMTNLLGDPDPLNDPSHAEALSSELAEARACSGGDCP